MERSFRLQARSAHLATVIDELPRLERIPCNQRRKFFGEPKWSGEFRVLKYWNVARFWTRVMTTGRIMENFMKKKVGKKTQSMPRQKTPFACSYLNRRGGITLVFLHAISDRKYIHSIENLIVSVFYAYRFCTQALCFRVISF